MGYMIDYKKDYSGGENSAGSPDTINANEALIFENANPINGGGFTRRNGFALDKTFPFHPDYEGHQDDSATYNKLVTRIMEFEMVSAGGVKSIKRVAVSFNDLVDYTTGALIKKLILESPMNLIDICLGLTVDYEVYNNKLYILTAGQFLVYDGTTCIDVANAAGDSNLAKIKKCKYIERRGVRFFAAGNPDEPNTLYFSEPADPTYWKVLSVINAVSEGVDKIYALKEYHGALLVFQAKAVYAWFGYDPDIDVTFERLSVHTGTRAYRSVQQVEDLLVFLGEDGVYALKGTLENVIATVKLSRNITSRIDNTQKNPANYYGISDVLGFVERSCAIYHEGRYMLSMYSADTTYPAKQYQNIVFVLHTDFTDLANGKICWGIYTGMPVCEWFKSVTNEVYFGLASGIRQTGKLNKTYNDNTAAIAVNVKSNTMHQGEPVKNKKYRYGYVYLRQYDTVNSSADIHAFVDYAEVDTHIDPNESLIWDIEGRSWDETKWDFTDLVTRRFTLKEKGKRVIVQFTDSTVDQALTVYGFGVEYRIKKPDRG